MSNDADDKIALLNRSVASAFKDYEKAIVLCVNSKDKLGTPALVLTYSAIDLAGWLDCAGKATWSTFVRWVEKYMLPSSDLTCTAMEIYAARCGVVHTFAPESALSRNENIRQLYYAWGDDTAEKLQVMIDDSVKIKRLVGDSGEGNVVLAVQGEKLIDAFRAGLVRFRKEIEENPDCLARVHGKAGKLFKQLSAKDREPFERGHLLIKAVTDESIQTDV